MTDLSYKTRWNGPPGGKQKVYFCCYPKDKNLYFDTIVKEILDRHDCAIWYKTDINSSTDDELLREIEQMQLVVVLVTRSFLEEENHAREKELAHAVKNHIPVLPIMMDFGLENIFNQVCGEIQFLQKNHIDGSELPYEEKLSQFLSTILVGEEEVERIRSHFQGYIFLSYRKKDRWKAQNLMQAIHSMDCCRDLAIWYDEFLTPGENFNNEIESALKKSNLFVMAVTNNMIGEENYVLDVEYPMAKKLHKRILPVQLEDLLIRKLPEKCSDLPELIDFTSADITELEKKMENFLADFDKKKINDAEHLYYIGLSYLNGIDLEKNSDFGTSLIEQAAKQRFVPAMIKMAELYQEGNGVRRDYHKTLYWKEKVLEEKEKILKEGSVPENRKEYFEDLIYHFIGLAEGYRKIYEFEKSKQCFEKIAAYTEPLRREIDSFYLGRMHVAACQRVGLWYLDRKEVETAAAWLAKATEHIIYMLENRKDISYEYAMKELGKICRYQGLLYAQAGRMEQAVNFMQDGIDKLKTIKMDFWTCMELQDLYVHYVDTLIQLERFDEAAAFWPECGYLLDVQKKEKEDEDYFENVFRMHRVFTRLFFKIKEYEKAEYHALAAYHACKVLWREDDSYKNQEKFFQICEELAFILVKQNRIREARAYRMQSAYLSLLFYRQRRTEEEKKRFMEYCIFVAQLMRINEDTTDARKIFREYEWTKMVEVEETNSPEAKEDLATAYFMQTLLAWSDRNDCHVHQKMIQETYDIWKELCNGRPEYEALLQILEKENPSLEFSNFRRNMEERADRLLDSILADWEDFDGKDLVAENYESAEDDLYEDDFEFVSKSKLPRWMKKLFGKKGE